MPQRFEPKFSILPTAQREIWASLMPAQQLGFVLYGGTAVALHLGHRESLDFDFFRSEPLDKDQMRATFGFAGGAAILQDMPDTLVLLRSGAYLIHDDGFYRHVRAREERVEALEEQVLGVMAHHQR